MKPSDDLRARVLAAAMEEPSPTRRMLANRGLALTAVVAVVVAMAFTLKGGFDLLEGTRPLSFVIGTAAGWAAIAGLCTAVAFGRPRSMLGWSRGWLIGAAIGAPLLLVIWTLAWAALYPETTHECPAPISPIGNRCRELIFAITAAPLLTLLVARRATVAVQPVWTGAAIGAALGVVAGTVIDVQCGCVAPLHVLVGHVLPVAVLAAAGALGGRWLLAIRGR